MANQLKMAKKQAILGLLEQGWSYRRIARELGVHRETVARYDRLENPKPSISAPGFGSFGGSKPAIPAAGSGLGVSPKPSISPSGSVARPGQTSLCQPLSAEIEKKLDLGLSAQRIYQDLRADFGFSGSYTSVKRFVRSLSKKNELPFRHLEVEPGLEAQVDFGAGAWVVSEGRKRRPHILRVVLSHSRKGYSEPVYGQTTENFIRCLENAFRHFGGAPKTLVIDNLRAAVKSADWCDPELNPKVVDFGRHYGLVILPTKPYTPHHKGKVESGVKYVKANALKGRVFGSLEEQKSFLAHWEANVADTRIHGTTKKQVRKVFEEVERPALQPLPSESFPFYHEGRRRVHRDAHVEVERAYYSVPPEYLGREVWARWDSRLVRLFNDRFEQIALHPKTGPGRSSTDLVHLSHKKISGVERGAQWLLDKAFRLGPNAHEWARAMLEKRGIEGLRALQGFLALAKKHSAREIDRASEIALRSNLFRLRQLRELIHRVAQQPELDFAETHEIIRPLSQYQELLSVISFKPKEDL